MAAKKPTKRAPRKSRAKKEEAAAPLAVTEEIKADEPKPEPNPEPEAPPKDEREWMTLGEVEEEVGISRTLIAQMVAAGRIPGMEPGKQGRPQEWYGHHVELLKKQLRSRRIIRSLSDPDRVAAACNVEPHRLEMGTAAITSKGLRIIDSSKSLRSLRQITKDPIIIFPE